MKRCLFIVLVSLLGVARASATPCAPGTLQGYIGLGVTGCSIGPVRLANFAIAPGQTIATPIDPATIQVTPGGTWSAPALTLTLGSSAPAGKLFEAFFRFSVSGAGPLDASIATSSAGATGDGAVTATQDLCPDRVFAGTSPTGCPSAPPPLIAFATVLDADPDSTVSVSPTAYLDVFTDVVVDGGPSGTASLGAVTLSLGGVPEPSLTAQLVTGLVALACLRRMRAR